MNIKNFILNKSSLFIILLLAGIFFQSVPFIIIAISLFELSLTEKYFEIRIPNSFSWIFVIFVILSLVLGSYADFYEKFSWWDDMLHFSYGIGFAFLGYLIIYYTSYRLKINQHIVIIVAFSFCFSVAFGAIWEIFEYSMDVFFGMNMQRTENGVHDTMHDIILETIATMVTNFYILMYLLNQEKNWVGRLTERFIRINKKSPS